MPELDVSGYREGMTPGIRRSSVAFLLLAATTLTGCGAASCDTAMRFSTLALDFSVIPNSGNLDFVVECLDREDQNACTQFGAGKRYDAATESSVYMWIGVRAVRVTLYDKATQAVVAERTLDPISWDPPTKDGPCGPPQAKAEWKL